MNKTTSNPYAPPQAEFTRLVGAHCFRDGNVLVIPQGQELPSRCVKCNEAAIMDKPRSFGWHHPGWYALIILNIVVYLIAAVIKHKKVKLAVGLCDVHRKKRRTLNMIAFATFAVGLIGLFIGIRDSEPLFAFGGAPLLLIAIIAGIIGGRSIYPAKITKEEARMKGCGEAFLASLPPR